jgi:hypothetical protein
VPRVTCSRTVDTKSASTVPLRFILTSEEKTHSLKNMCDLLRNCLHEIFLYCPFKVYFDSEYKMDLQCAICSGGTVFTKSSSTVPLRVHFDRRRDDRST